MKITARIDGIEKATLLLSGQSNQVKDRP